MPIRIKPEQAALGMYVQGFDGNWLSHPFWRAHFVIESDADLLRIRNGGTDLFIDPAKGATVAPATRARGEERIRHARITPAAPTMAPPSAARLKRPPKRIVAPRAFGKADESRAAALAQRSTKVVKALFDDCRLG